MLDRSLAVELNRKQAAGFLRGLGASVSPVAMITSARQPRGVGNAPVRERRAARDAVLARIEAARVLTWRGERRRQRVENLRAEPQFTIALMTNHERVLWARAGRPGLGASRQAHKPCGELRYHYDRQLLAVRRREGAVRRAA